MFISVIYGLLLSVGIVQVLAWLRDRRWATALVGGTYLFAYPADLLAIESYRSLNLTPSISLALPDEGTRFAAMVAVVACWVVFSFLVHVGTVKVTSATPDDHLTVSDAKPRTFTYLIIVFFMVATVLRQVSGSGLEAVLTARQDTFGGHPIALLAYYGLPILLPFGLACLPSVTRVRGWLIFIAGLSAAMATALTGSRSALLLSCLLPAAVILWCWAASMGKGPGGCKLGQAWGDLNKMFIVAGVAVATAGATTWYLVTFRGVRESGSLFQGTDVSQGDVFLALLQSPPPLNFGSSYLAGLTTLIPRSWWPTKPLPGNVIVSYVLTPERYTLTGAETTAGILGEGFVNFGVGGWLIAAVLMAFLVRTCERLLASHNEAVWVLGFVLTIRGVNLVRGDLANTVAPLLVSAIVWWMVFRLRRVTSLVRSAPVPLR